MTKQFCAALAAFGIVVASVPAIAADQSWVDKSNENASLVLEVIAGFNPESAASLGVDGIDENVVDFHPKLFERSIAASEEVLQELRERQKTETDRRVLQDLGILVGSVEDSIRTQKLNREYMLPYYNLSQTVFLGVRGLIDPQIPRERYPAALVRMNKYAGLEGDDKPLTELAKDRSRERFDVDGLVGPYRGEVLQDLERADSMIDGIEQLLTGTDLQGWEKTYEVLAGQLRDYNDWVRAEILPRAREDFRLPAAIYEDALRNWGVDAEPLDLIEQATKGYMDIRNEMEALAPLVAKEKGYETSDYREVIAFLKRDGAIDGDKMLDHYNAVLGEIEEIIVREKIITLPERDAGIRIASEAETAVQPAPHLDIPRLLGNTGEYPFFVIPQLKQNEDGSWQQTDDTYAAGSWTLTAHEARPGHEMQFSSIIESGVSTARALFAFNSANVEGRGRRAPLPAARGSAHQPAISTDAGRSHVPRPDAEPRPDHARRGKAPDRGGHGRGRILGAERGGALYLSHARSGHGVLLRLQQDAVVACPDRVEVAGQVRPAGLPRLRARAGHATAGYPPGRRHGELRTVAGEFLTAARKPGTRRYTLPLGAEGQ
jgi:hypothetical protein